MLVVGGGPSGLAAGIALRRQGIASVLVVDREQEAGGIPRHSNHPGFGWRDMHRFLSGPGYAARYVRLAEKAGVEVRTGVTVTGWQDKTILTTTAPDGLGEIRAQVVVLATGCRERPRAARLIPGTRPQGIFTTGALQQYVYLHKKAVGKRAVVIGAEHVSFSAVMTLKHAGVSVAAMVTDLPQHQTLFPYKLITTDRYRVPIVTNTQVSRILGKRRVEAVELADVSTGEVSSIECDTVVFTGDWIPDHELARLGGLTIDPGTNGPQVDLNLRTSVEGVFAVGNLIHAAETADVAALSGRYVAKHVRNFLENRAWRDLSTLSIEYDKPISWISPNLITPQQARAPHDHFIIRVSRVLVRPTLEIRQGDRILWRKKYRRMLPNLSISVPARWLHAVGACQEVIRFTVS